MSDNSEALARLRRAGLESDEVMDIYEQYLEDKERFSEATALEKLDGAISDATAV